jgi:glucose uptake protein GlcU
MVASGLVTLYYGVEKFLDAGGGVARASQFLWGNLTLLSAFVVFVSLAIAYRARPAAHKRLMLLAALAMIVQSLGRIGTFPAFQLGSSPELSEAVFGLGGLAALLAVLVIHDWTVMRRVHRAVAWGAPLLLGGILFIAFVVSSTSFGQSLVRALF